MIRYLTGDLIYHILVFQVIILLVILWNLYLIQRPRKHDTPTTYPKVSILIPARNEQHAIAACLESLLTQNYPDYEVIVLDDQSTDRTRQILLETFKKYPQLQILDGLPPPTDQAGKTWACSQLAEKASGDVLFFTDADTIHHPDTLTTAVASLEGEGADFITGFPRQLLGTWGERLLVPFFSWASLTFLPLGIAYFLPTPGLSAAVGQMMLFRREAYQKIGGHAAIGSAIVEDLQLARNIKKLGYKWRVVSIRDRISCRMYRDSKEAWQGFIKNLFAAFDFRLLPFLFAFSWLLVMFWAPLVVLLLQLIGLAPLANISHLLTCIALSLVIWALPYSKLGINPWLAFLYPINLIANISAASISLNHSLTGKLIWKDRRLKAPKWKWI